MSCKKGGLVGQRHDDLRDEIVHLCGLALSTGRVNSEPTFFYGNGTSASRGNQSTEAALGDESRGDIYAHGLWKRGTGCVMDCRVTDTDAKSYGNVASAKILERHARERKRNMRRPAVSAGGTLFPWFTQLMGCQAKRLELPKGGLRVFWLPSGIGSTVRCVALFEGGLHFQLQGPPHCSCGVIG